VRASCSGRCVSGDEPARRSRDRGRRSTGSYEGSPPMEGIPDHHEPSAFTSRRSRWSRRLLHAPKMMAGEGRAHRERKKERRQGCQRLGRSRAPWEENAHARRQAGQQPAGREAKYTPSSRALCVLDDPPKRSERRESVRFPGQAARSPNSERRPRGESRGSVAGNRRGAGARRFVRVAEVDRTRRASCPPGDRKVSWR
jgi:hypothetical protein